MRDLAAHPSNKVAGICFGDLEEGHLWLSEVPSQEVCHPADLLGLPDCFAGEGIFADGVVGEGVSVDGDDGGEIV